MDLDAGRSFLGESHRAVLRTFRVDGRSQTSPLMCGLDEAGRVERAGPDGSG